MTKLIKSAVALALVSAFTAPLAAQATTVDYRHEMKDTGKQMNHRDRIAVSNRFANGIGFSVEAKFISSKRDDGSAETRAFNNPVSNGTELGASYLQKFDDSPFTLTYGITFESSSTASVYKPYVTAGYKFDKDLSTTFRYRPYFQRVGNGAGDDDKGYNLTWVVNYQLTKDISLAHELDYKKSEEGKILANNEDYDWSNDLKITYKLSNEWRPYVAVGNVSGSSKTDERQTRYRVGVQYVF